MTTDAQAHARHTAITRARDWFATLPGDQQIAVHATTHHDDPRHVVDAHGRPGVLADCRTCWGTGVAFTPLVPTTPDLHPGDAVTDPTTAHEHQPYGDGSLDWAADGPCLLCGRGPDDDLHAQHWATATAGETREPAPARHDHPEPEPRPDRQAPTTLGPGRSRWDRWNA